MASAITEPYAAAPPRSITGHESSRSAATGCGCGWRDGDRFAWVVGGRPTALRGSVLRSGAYVITVLLSLVSVPLLIRHLGIAQFGRYTTVVALVTVAGGLTDAGLLSIGMREWTTRSGRERSLVMRQLLGVRIELSAAAVVAAVAFAWVTGFSPTLVLGTFVAGVGMFLQVIADLLTSPLQGDLRFGWASMIDVSRQTVLVICIVSLVLAGAGLLPLLAATIASGAVALTIAATLARRSMSLAPVFRGGEQWALIRETIPYAAAIALNTVYFRVTIIVMSLLATAQQTGYFATSFRVTEVLVGVPALAVGAAFPILSRAARTDQERFANAVGRILELAMVGAGLVLVVVLSAPLCDRGARRLQGRARRTGASDPGTGPASELRLRCVRVSRCRYATRRLSCLPTEALCLPISC